MTEKINWSIQQLNAIFKDITEIAESIFWIRSINYNQQIYLSPNFSSYWGIGVDFLYEHPQRFIDTIINIKNPSQIVLSKRSNLVSMNFIEWEKIISETIFFQVKHPNNKSVFVKDRAFLLKNSSNQISAIAGFAYIIPENEWQLERDGENITNYRIKLEEVLIKIVEKTLRLFPVNPIILTGDINNQASKKQKIKIKINNQDFTFTPREIQCLYYSLQGFSAKVIARELNISPRTVEIYLEQLKKKLDCRTKLQMLGKFNLDSINLFETFI